MIPLVFKRMSISTLNKTMLVSQLFRCLDSMVFVIIATPSNVQCSQRNQLMVPWLPLYLPPPRVVLWRFIANFFAGIVAQRDNTYYFDCFLWLGHSYGKSQTKILGHTWSPVTHVIEIPPSFLPLLVHTEEARYSFDQVCSGTFVRDSTSEASS